MKAITVKQPWAWAIATGAKDIENRSRSLGPYRGQVAIHAGKSWSKAGARDPRVRELFAPHLYRDEEAAGRIDLALHHDKFPLGAVIAVGDLVAEHQPRAAECGCSLWADRSYEEAPVGAHIRIGNVVRLAEPVPARGFLGLWPLPEDVEEAVLAELARAREIGVGRV